jgi:hypothetical protein
MLEPHRNEVCLFCWGIEMKEVWNGWTCNLDEEAVNEYRILMWKSFGKPLL